jgi:hypothetical protein
MQQCQATEVMMARPKVIFIFTFAFDADDIIITTRLPSQYTVVTGLLLCTTITLDMHPTKSLPSRL